MELLTVAFLLLAGASSATNTSHYTNPILPGFHPDPSCIYVEELDQTFFCATSTFTAFPGIPIHASKDLMNWKLASNVLNRREQLPSFANAPTGQDGIFAPTLRHHNGTFYLITTNVAISSYADFAMDNVIFTTTDPYNSTAWSIPTAVPGFLGYDPSLFWDDDGTTYFVGAAATSTGTAIALSAIDPATGRLIGNTTSYPYNGTGIGTSEGPHVYKRDGWYYMLVAEGGSDRAHRGAVARSRDVAGPYANDPANPFVAVADANSSYVQSVGHADLFHDAQGNWWGVALATRSGPAFENYPMGRETVLFPVEWSEEGWPRVVGGVQGAMTGPLPARYRGAEMPGEGAWHDAPDVVDFAAGEALPRHFLHVRFPDEAAYEVRDGSLRLTPSPRNLSAPLTSETDVGKEITFVGRRQVDTLFTYSVDVAFDPEREGDEAGVAVYVDEGKHVDLGIVRDGDDGRRLRMRFFSTNNVTVPRDVTASFPVGAEAGGLLRLEVKAANLTHFTFSAGAVTGEADGDVEMVVVGAAEGSLVSGGYTGALLGVYATTNGVVSNGTSKAYVSRWRYQGQGQYIGGGQYA
ncbi:Xylosidase/arabinosidase [Diplodia seriata]|uniref:Xylosidase/arabinosidase n=1 Tax=Diplodia seriata TaxID=420778 RepID=A0A1S8BJ96_9PEZI|nr:Xylosidase/arabinosidase [Diplodia seriata]